MKSWKADVTRFLTVRTAGPDDLADLTEKVNEIVYQSEVHGGLCYLFTPHRETTLELASGADQDAAEGLPRNQLTLLVVDRRLFLAPGQRAVLREVAGTGPADAERAAPAPRRRRVLVRVLDGAGGAAPGDKSLMAAEGGPDESELPAGSGGSPTRADESSV